MKLGFVSAILQEMSLEEVVSFASSESFDCVELMCWPVGKSERRYAGITHINMDELDEGKAGQIKDLTESAGISISGLGTGMSMNMHRQPRAEARPRWQ